MDPVSHAALGRSLAAFVRDGRGPRGAVAAFVLGSFGPDIDAVVMPFGWDRYLRVHEIGTHSVVGTFACALATAAALRALRSPAGWRPLVAGAWLGALGHVLLDMISSARIRVLWPLVEAQASLPLVAMADPWLAVLLAAVFPALWIAGRRSPRRIALLVLGAAAVFLGGKAVLAARAVGAYRAAAPQPLPFIVEARWGSLSGWRVYDRTPSSVRAWSADGWPRRAALDFAWPLAPDTAAVAASRRLSVVRNFLHAHDMTFAVVLPQDGGTRVLWSDVRFCARRTPGERRPEGDVPLAAAADGTRLTCSLWFGADFDAAGAAVRQVLRVGGVTQTRAPGS